MAEQKVVNVLADVYQPTLEIHQYLSKKLGLQLTDEPTKAVYDLAGFLEAVLEIIKGTEAEKAHARANEILSQYLLEKDVKVAIEKAIETLKPVIAEHILRYKPPYYDHYSYELVSSKKFSILICFHGRKKK